MRRRGHSRFVLSLLTGLSILALAGCGGETNGNKGSIKLPASVTQISPQPDAQGLPVTSLVVVHFSRQISLTEAEAFSLGLYSGEDPVPVRMTLLPEGETLVLDPTHDLDPATLYEVHGSSSLPEPGQVTEKVTLTKFTTSGSVQGGPQFQFDPTDAKQLFPYPTDIYTVPDDSSATGLRVRIPPALVPSDIRQEDIDAMDGFSPYPRFILPVTSAPDLEALTHDIEDTKSPLSPLFLIDLDDAVHQRMPVFIEMDPFGPFQAPPSYNLKVMPLFPLELSRHYALVVTRRMAAATGAPAEPSSTFMKMIQGEDLSGIEDAYGRIKPVVDFLSSPERDLPLDPEDLALVVPFTTRSLPNLTDELSQIRNYHSAHCPESPPKVTISSVTVPCPFLEGPDGHVAVYVKGTVESPDFRNKAGILDPNLVYNHPEEAPLVPLEFILSIPKGARDTPAPVVVFLHGIDDSKEAVYAITEELASYNLAAIAIDVVEHGSRATSRAIPWVNFLRIDDIHCGRDNMRQTQSDLMNLTWAIRTSLAAPDLFYWEEGQGYLTLDPENIFFIGNSLGSIISPGFLALEDGVRGAVLFVGAGNMTEIVTRFEALQPGTHVFDILSCAIGLARGYPVAQIVYGVLDLGQEIFDQADPLTYAPYVIKSNLPGCHRSKDVLFIQVIGDQTLANTTNEHLARALGLQLIKPVKREIPGIEATAAPACGNGPRGSTAGLLQFDEVTVGGTKVKATHDNVLDGQEPVKAACIFFTTIATTGRGVIEDTRQ